MRSITSGISGIDVLIETYWNVKMSPAKTRRNEEVVLIETYWNVKETTSRFRVSTGRCINRNILECKGEPGNKKPPRGNAY